MPASCENKVFAYGEAKIARHQLRANLEEFLGHGRPNQIQSNPHGAPAAGPFDTDLVLCKITCRQVQFLRPRHALPREKGCWAKSIRRRKNIE